MTLQIHLAPDTSGLGLRFPMDQCVNCGTRQGVTGDFLTLKWTTYLLVAGTETTFTFPAASCDRCAPSMARPALSTGHKLFGGALTIAAIMTFAFLHVSLGLSPPWLESNWFWLSVLAGGLPAWLWFSRHRFEHPQTSYYQAIRLKKLERRFGGEIVQMTFAFTNPDVMRTFTNQNRALIDAGFVRAVST